MNELAKLAGLTGAALVIWVAFYVFVPWALRLMALYGLHDLRDSLYRSARRLPMLRETLLYRDIEYILCVAIHIVRDQDHGVAVGLAEGLRGAGAEHADRRWRFEQYCKDLVEVVAQGDIGPEVLPALFELPAQAERFVIMRAISGHPLNFLIWVFSRVASAMRLIAEEQSLEALARAVGVIESGPTPSKGDAAAAHLAAA